MLMNIGVRRHQVGQRIQLEKIREDAAERLGGGATGRHWQMRGHRREAAERLDGVLALEADCDKLEPRARGLEAAGGVAYWMGNLPRARSHFERMPGIRSPLGGPRG